MAKGKRKTTADKAKRAQEGDAPSDSHDAMGDAARGLAPGGALLRPNDSHILGFHNTNRALCSLRYPGMAFREGRLLGHHLRSAEELPC